MKTRPSIEIFRYWQTLCQGGRIPSRVDIDPGAIRHSLADTFILERDDMRSPRFRLAGTRICALFLRELRGMGFDSLWSAGEIDGLLEITQRVMRDGVPVVLLSSGVNTDGDRIEVEITLLPLRSGDGGIDRIFGAMTPLTKPSWIGAHPLPFLTLESASLPQADTRLPDLPVRTALSRSFAAPVQSNPLRQALRRVMHLSVLEGGKSH